MIYIIHNANDITFSPVKYSKCIMLQNPFCLGIGFIHIVAPLVCVGFVFCPCFCNAVRSVCSNCVIISLKERELVALL